MKKKYKNIVMFLIVGFCLYILFDLFNIPSKIGLIVSNLNNDILGIATSAVVALIIYFISYNEIDDRKIKREENSRNTAKVLLINAYIECLDNLKLVNDKQIVKEFIVPKVDFDKTDSENKVVRNLQTLPFESFNAIMQLSKDGFIEKSAFDTYLSIKKEFNYVISSKITFFDIDEAQEPLPQSYRKVLNKRYNGLIDDIKKEINNLKSEV